MLSLGRCFQAVLLSWCVQTTLFVAIWRSSRRGLGGVARAVDRRRIWGGVCGLQNSSKKQPVCATLADFAHRDKKTALPRGVELRAQAGSLCHDDGARLLRGSAESTTLRITAPEPFFWGFSMAREAELR
jgi:hypothetical protein